MISNENEDRAWAAYNAQATKRLNPDTGVIEELVNGVWWETEVPMAQPLANRKILGFLSDQEIRATFGPSEQSLRLSSGSIEPFYDGGPEPYKLTRGLSSVGYDLTMADEIAIVGHNNRGRDAYSNTMYNCVDPKLSPLLHAQQSINGYYLLQPNKAILTRSVEYIKMPPDVLGICLGKSTYARCGVLVNATPLEPNWEGHLTIEVSNTSDETVKIYVNEGICQVLFVRFDGIVEVDYSKKKSPYQGQRGIKGSEVRK